LFAASIPCSVKADRMKNGSKTPWWKKTAARKTLATVFAAASAYAAQNYVWSNQFGLRATMGVVTSENVLPSGFYVHVPWAQYTHSYDNHTQKITFNAGCG